jgi:hypothetical protein
MDYFFLIGGGVYLVGLSVFLQQVRRASEAFLCLAWPIFLTVALVLELKEAIYERRAR